MKRVHLIEIHDLDWCPRSVRNGETDYVQFVIATTKPYAVMVPILASALECSGTRQVLDLCSGAAGPWLWLQPVLAERGVLVSVCLTDKYPNPEAVDAMRVPDELTGFRTMFSAFHHFRPEQARAVLADAAHKRQGIAVFEGTQRSVLALLLMLLVPLMVLLMTPFIRPFRWARLLWTYLIPVLRFVALFDGLISCLRTYSVEDLRDLTATLGRNDYHWEMGAVKSKAGPILITYLIGVPNEKAA
jgi:hypothetical protein